jgi:hypothetical protein
MKQVLQNNHSLFSYFVNYVKPFCHVCGLAVAWKLQTKFHFQFPYSLEQRFPDFLLAKNLWLWKITTDPQILAHVTVMCGWFFFQVRQLLVDQSLLIIEVLQSLSDTPHPAVFHRTSDQPDAETSIWQHTTITRDRNPWLRRDSNSQSKQASERPQTRALDRAATGVGFRMRGIQN